VDLHAPPCCATVGDLGHNGPDTVTWSGCYGIKKNEKEKKKKKKKRRNVSHSRRAFPGFTVWWLFLRPLVAGQKDAFWSLAAAFLRQMSWCRFVGDSLGGGVLQPAQILALNSTHGRRHVAEMTLKAGTASTLLCSIMLRMTDRYNELHWQWIFSQFCIVTKSRTMWSYLL